MNIQQIFINSFAIGLVIGYIYVILYKRKKRR